MISSEAHSILSPIFTIQFAVYAIVMLEPVVEKAINRVNLKYKSKFQKLDISLGIFRKNHVSGATIR